MTSMRIFRKQVFGKQVFGKQFSAALVCGLMLTLCSLTSFAQQSSYSLTFVNAQWEVKQLARAEKEKLIEGAE